MLNIIWPLFIIISFIYAFFSGNIENVSNGIFTSLTEVVNLCLTFLGTMCLWNGIMEIAKRTTLIRKLTIFFRPLINFLFPELKENEQELVVQIEIPLTIVLAKMEHFGVSIDVEYLKELSAYMTEKLAELEDIIYQLAGGPFNINSPKQVAEVLFDKLEIKNKKKKLKKYRKLLTYIIIVVE